MEFHEEVETCVLTRLNRPRDLPSRPRPSFATSARLAVSGTNITWVADHHMGGVHASYAFARIVAAIPSQQGKALGYVKRLHQ